MWRGVLFALIAGMMWGTVFIAPLLVPDYSAAMLAFGRVLAFGCIALTLAWMDRAELARLKRADWLEALKLSAIGSVLYYFCLASAIQRAGAPVPTVIIGVLPVVIAIWANVRNVRRDGRLPWRRLLPSLVLIGAGIGCVNQAEISALASAGTVDRARYGGGIMLAFIANACWAWYALRNADWLRHHAERNPRIWATTQGVATLPLALVGYLAVIAWQGSADPGFALPFGPQPAQFVAVLLVTGLLASWVGTLCWNEASQRLPTSLAGQLIVFETLSALVYAFLLRGAWPGATTLLGIVLLLAGILWAVRIKPE
jgi:drug/metabolite transporter (DMT)-like permease